MPFVDGLESYITYEGEFVPRVQRIRRCSPRRSGRFRVQEPQPSVIKTKKTDNTVIRTWPYLDHNVHMSYLRQLVAYADSLAEQPLSPAVQALKNAIESTPRLYMYFTEMFSEIQPESRYGEYPAVIRDYEHLLQALSAITKTAPPPGAKVALPPLAMLLMYPANTARLLCTSG